MIKHRKYINICIYLFTVSLYLFFSELLDLKGLLTQDKLSYVDQMSCKLTSSRPPPGYPRSDTVGDLYYLSQNLWPLPPEENEEIKLAQNE